MCFQYATINNTQQLTIRNAVRKRCFFGTAFEKIYISVLSSIQRHELFKIRGFVKNPFKCRFSFFQRKIKSVQLIEVLEVVGELEKKQLSCSRKNLLFFLRIDRKRTNCQLSSSVHGFKSFEVSQKKEAK